MIDDDEFFAENLRNYIKKFHDIIIEHAGKVDVALEKISQTSYDLVIADIQLPGSLGSEWLLEIEKIRPGQRIIVASSFNIAKEPGLAEKINLIGYYEKPFDPKMIVNLIGQLVHKPQKIN